MGSKELGRAFFKEVFLGGETIGQWDVGAHGSNIIGFYGI